VGVLAGADERLHPSLPYTSAEVIWAVREEMALTVEDVLARRTRALFLDARAAVEMAPSVAEILARELGRNDEWRRAQVQAFLRTAANYLLG
jgi:glycerol-3-phosphate dehydrogenase